MGLASFSARARLDHQRVSVRKLFAVLLFGSTAFAQTTPVARPPQFVVMAFDGGLEPGLWNEVLGFARAARRDSQIEVKFTVFISGTFLVPTASRAVYHSPAFPPCKASCPNGEGDCPRRCRKPGQASVSFGGTLEDLKARIRVINEALGEGHELASHANGHFDGSSWSEAEWSSEFDFFHRVIFDTAQVSGIREADFPRIALDPKRLQGFRAPFLATSAGMSAALKKANYRYDASGDNDIDYWPRKNKVGVWNFPLANLPVPGTTKSVLSMDYNFFVMDGGDKTAATLDQAKAKALEDRMVVTYLSYFRHNYLGNRAPVQLGHHFTQYMKGVYWRALQRVAREVCGQPEVRCVTMSELANFLDGVDDATRSAYQGQRFPAYAPSTADETPQALGLAPIRAEAEISWEPLSERVLGIRASGPDADKLLASDITWEWSLAGRPISTGLKPDFRKLMAAFAEGAVLEVRALKGRAQTEIFRSARKLSLGTNGGVRLGEEDLDRAGRLTADPPEAHRESN